MKRSIFKRRPMVLAVAMVASPLLQAQGLSSNTDMYMGFNVGESTSHIDNGRITRNVLGAGTTINSLSQDDTDTAYKAYVGVPINHNWAVEMGYFDLGRFNFTANTTPAGVLNGSSRIRGLNLDLVGNLLLSDRWSLQGRLGAIHAQTRDNFSGPAASSVADTSPSKRETNYKFGIGTQYALSPALSLRLEAERYRVNDAVSNRNNVDMVSLGLVYRFGGSPAPAQKVAYTPYVAPAPPPVVAQAPMPAPPPPPAPKPWVKVKLEADTLFGFDKDTLQPEGKQALDKLLMQLSTVNIDRIQVIGHTDRLGSKAHNDKLSVRRAEVVRNYLVQVGGIPGAKVTATGMGSQAPETQPGQCKGTHPSPALIHCLRADRRVDVEVLGSEQQR